MLSATSCADSSGRLISSTLIADFLAGELGELVAQLVDLGALLADHDARTAGVHRDDDLARLALDVDVGDGRVAEAGLEILPDQLVFLEQRRHVLVGVPPRRPLLDDAEPEPDRMRLLSHAQLSLLATWISTWLVRLRIGVARPCAAAVNRLSGWPPLMNAVFT